MPVLPCSASLPVSLHFKHLPPVFKYWNSKERSLIKQFATREGRIGAGSLKKFLLGSPEVQLKLMLAVSLGLCYLEEVSSAFRDDFPTLYMSFVDAVPVIY